MAKKTARRRPVTFLKEYRLSLGLTLEALGRKVGRSGSNVWGWENSVCVPDAATMPKLAAVLGVSTGHLLRKFFPGQVDSPRRRKAEAA